MVDLPALRFLEFARGADGDDFAGVDDGDAVAEALGFLDVVGGHQDGALFGAEFGEQRVDFKADLRVEAGGGLVEEEQRGVVDEAQRDGEALLLAAGESGVKRVALSRRAAGA
jgi:hypothetical protein